MYKIVYCNVYVIVKLQGIETLGLGMPKSCFSFCTPPHCLCTGMNAKGEAKFLPGYRTIT